VITIAPQHHRPDLRTDYPWSRSRRSLPWPPASRIPGSGRLGGARLNSDSDADELAVRLAPWFRRSLQ